MNNYDVPNMDCLDADELRDIGDDNRAPVVVRKYANTKRKAVLARLAGRIADAMNHEDDCERIYKSMPAELRW